VFDNQTGHHLRENTFPAPTLPMAVERLVRILSVGCVAPAQAIAIDEDNTAQHPPVIDPWPAMGFRKEGRQTCHLRVGQQDKVADVTAPFSEP
jgi:hypothetical protein